MHERIEDEHRAKRIDGIGKPHLVIILIDAQRRRGDAVEVERSELDASASTGMSGRNRPSQPATPPGHARRLCNVLASSLTRDDALRCLH